MNSTNMKKLIVKKIHHKGVMDFDLAEQLLESNAEFKFIETINWTENPDCHQPAYFGELLFE